MTDIYMDFETNRVSVKIFVIQKKPRQRAEALYCNPNVINHL